MLKRKELLLLRLHHARGDVVAAEPLPELDPGESLAILNLVGLPPVQSCPSQLSCCVQDMLPIIALGDVQLALHCTEQVVCLKWVRRVRERRRVAPQKLGMPVAGLRRWRRRRLCAAVPEQCCSGWPSSASGAERTAPESRVEASASRYPGCSDPAAGQNQNRCSWCSPSDLNKRCMSKDIAGIIYTDMISFCKEDLGMI